MSPAPVAQQRAREGCVVPRPFVRTLTFFAHISRQWRSGCRDRAASEVSPELLPLAHNGSGGYVLRALVDLCSIAKGIPTATTHTVTSTPSLNETAAPRALGITGLLRSIQKKKVVHRTILLRERLIGSTGHVSVGTATVGTERQIAVGA